MCGFSSFWGAGVFISEIIAVINMIPERTTKKTNPDGETGFNFSTFSFVQIKLYAFRIPNILKITILLAEIKVICA